MSRVGILIWDMMFAANFIAGVLTLVADAPLGVNNKVGGTVIASLGLAGWIFGVWLWGFGKTRQELASEEFRRKRSAFCTAKDHEFQVINPEDFGELDLEFYDTIRDWFVDKGFTLVGDLENVTHSRIFPNAETFYRILSGDDGSIIASMHHLNARGRSPRQIRAVELRTELSDASFIITNNQWKGNPRAPAAGIDLLQLPPACSTDDLLLLHRFRIAEALRSGSNLAVKRSLTLDECIALTRRLHIVLVEDHRTRETKAGATPEQTALRIYEGLRLMSSNTIRQYRTAIPAEFPQLDHDFYNGIQAQLVNRGFRILGDLEILAWTRIAPNRRTYVRCMISADETVLMGALNFKTAAKGSLCDTRIVQFETEFGNGDFLSTSNGIEIEEIVNPRIEQITLPAATPLDELLTTHLNRVTTILSRVLGLSANHIRNLDDCQASQRRMSEIVAKRARDIGFFNDRELQLLRQRKPRVRWQAIAIEIERLRKAELARAAAASVSKPPNGP